jgi:DNA-binding MarR family transcriptional regulator
MTDDESPQYRFGDLLALARGSWIRQIRARAEAAGFGEYRRTDSFVLGLLSSDALAIGELGQGIGISRQAARKIAGRLVDRGYADFVVDPDDGRRTLVVLTRRGTAYAKVVARAQDELNERIRSTTSADDLAAAARVLRSVFPTPSSNERLEEDRPTPE